MTREAQKELLKKAEADSPTNFAMLRGLADNMIWLRGDLLCGLSADDGEWGGCDLKKTVDLYCSMMERAEELANNCVDREHSTWLLWTMLTDACETWSQPLTLPF